MTNFKTLKTRHRAERDQQSDNLSLRIHRALSWLEKAEEHKEDEDTQFIFLWIAFNSAYANDTNQTSYLREHEVIEAFIERLCALDDKNRLSGLVWNEFPNAIRVLLDNKYVFTAYWHYQNGQITETEWKEAFSNAKHSANRALGKEKTGKVLSIVFSRIYTLRNQLMHGGATYNSQVNRSQMRDCCHLLSAIVPTIIEIMMDNQNQLWGDAYYPVKDR